MENTDTVYLLKECSSGIKMAISSVDEVLEKVKDEKVKELLSTSKSKHEEIDTRIQELLDKNHSDDKNPNIMAKSMSWIKTNWKMGVDESDATVADLITDGCDMGIKSLSRYKNQYKAANQETVDLCNDLIKIEEQLRDSLRQYL